MPDYKRYNRRSVKLTDVQVQEVRQLYFEKGWSQPQLARKFDMSAVQIGRIVRGESRRSVPELVDTSEVDVDPNAPPVDPEVLAESMERLKEKLDKKPVSAPTENTSDLASLVEGLRRKKAELAIQTDNAAEAAREETRDDSKDTTDGLPANLADRPIPDSD